VLRSNSSAFVLLPFLKLPVCSGSCSPYGHPAHDCRVALTLSLYSNSLNS